MEESRCLSFGHVCDEPFCSLSENCMDRMARSRACAGTVHTSRSLDNTSESFRNFKPTPGPLPQEHLFY